MARTNATAVGLIIDTDLTTPQIEAFIDDASLWVDEHLGGYTTLSADLLKAIEKYLAAHLICVRDARLTKAQRGDVGETYQRDAKVSEYLKSAAGLDPTGTIEDRLMEGRPKVNFRVSEGYDDTLDLSAESA